MANGEGVFEVLFDLFDGFGLVVLDKREGLGERESSPVFPFVRDKVASRRSCPSCQRISKATKCTGIASPRKRSP